ncbi:hypothetical protein V5799_026756 [Amblyomma americanum]|uniref:Secreted protein n=1 Tax=Amblyomma americanum TaxID=6943 RepID=A0AAQ4DHN7_AMBAM
MMAANHVIWSAVLIVKWLVLCDSTEICYYTKELLGDCDPTTKTQQVKLTYLRGNSTCPRTKVETTVCHTGNSQFRQPDPAESAGNIRTLLQSGEPLVLGMGHEDLVGDGTIQCVKSSYHGRSVTDFYQFVYYSQREKNRNGNHEWTDRSFRVAYKVSENEDGAILNAIVIDSNPVERPISGTYIVLYSNKKCFVVRKGPASQSKYAIFIEISST